MIGIDVADLRDPLLHKRGIRAFQMIRHPLERLPGNCPEIAFWKFWTAKEAVYKALRTSTPFLPTTIQIIFSGETDFAGRCSPVNRHLYTGTISLLSNGGMLALAHHAEIEPPKFAVVSISTAPGSKELRQKAVAHFLQEFNEHVRFGTSANQLPVVQSTTNTCQYEVSLSHHGRFGAFAYSRCRGISQ